MNFNIPEEVMRPTLLIANSKDRAARSAISSLERSGYAIREVAPSETRGMPTVCEANTSTHPDPQRNFFQFEEWLRAFMQAHPAVVAVPVHEAIIHAANKIKEEEYVGSRFVLPPARSLLYSLSKYHSTQAAQQQGLTVPEAQYLREPGNTVISSLSPNVEFPILIKWDNTEDLESGYVKGACRVAHSRGECEAILAELSPSSCGIIAQELVPGHGVGAFFLRHKGRIVLKFAHRRVHEVPWTGGVSACCESSDDEEVLAAGERLLEAIDYEGVAMVEFRKEPGKPPVFLEINGRLWGSLGLALAAGADFPVAMVECHLHGKTKVEQPDLRRRVRWHDPGLEMDYLRSLWTKPPGPVDGPPPQWRGSLRVLRNFLDPRVKSDWWQWSDPCGSVKRYARLWRRELAWLKAAVLRHFRSLSPDPLVSEAVERTRRWREAPSRPGKILFLCYGNICRSPYAEARWNVWRFEEDGGLPSAFSTGFHEKTGRETPARFQAAARHRGVALESHRSRRATHEELESAELIFAMDLRNLKDVQRDFPDMLGKTLLLGALGDSIDPEIPDPYGQPIGAGGEAYQRIDRELECLRNILTRLT